MQSFSLGFWNPFFCLYQKGKTHENFFRQEGTISALKEIEVHEGESRLGQDIRDGVGLELAGGGPMLAADTDIRIFGYVGRGEDGYSSQEEEEKTSHLGQEAGIPSPVGGGFL